MPPEFAAFMIALQPLFSKAVFQHAQVRAAGTILTPGRRTVARALRVMELGRLVTFQNYHRVLSRAQWSARRAASEPLRLLVQTFRGEEPPVFGIDDATQDAGAAGRSTPEASTAIRCAVARDTSPRPAGSGGSG